MKSVKMALEAGDHHYNNGREKEALQSYIKAFRLTRKLLEQCDIMNEDYCHAFFVSVLRICDIVSITGQKEVLIDIYKMLLLTPSNKPIDNMICCERIGDVLFSIGNYKEALKCYEKQNAFSLINPHEYQDNFYYVRSRILSYERVGQALYKLRRYDEALDNFKDANQLINDGVKNGHPLMIEASAILKNIKQTNEMIGQYNQLYQARTGGE